MGVRAEDHVLEMVQVAHLHLPCQRLEPGFQPAKMQVLEDITRQGVTGRDQHRAFIPLQLQEQVAQDRILVRVDHIRLELVHQLADGSRAGDRQRTLPPERVGHAAHTDETYTLVLVLIRCIAFAGSDHRDLMTAYDHRPGDLLDDQRHSTDRGRIPMAEHQDAQDEPPQDSTIAWYVARRSRRVQLSGMGQQGSREWRMRKSMAERTAC